MGRMRLRLRSQVARQRSWKLSKLRPSRLCEVGLYHLACRDDADWIISIALILGGDFYTGSVLASALTKLVLRQSELSTDAKSTNSLRAEVKPMVVPFEVLALTDSRNA